MNLDVEAKLEFLCMYTATIDPKLEVKQENSQEGVRTVHLFRSVREPLYWEDRDEEYERDSERVPELSIEFLVEESNNVIITAEANEKYTDKLLETFLDYRGFIYRSEDEEVKSLYVIEPGGQVVCGNSYEMGDKIFIDVSISHKRFSRILNTIKQMVKQVFHSPSHA